MKTTFSRMVFTFVVILLAALLLVGTIFQLLVRNYLTDNVIQGLKKDCSTIAQVASAYYSGKSLKQGDFLMILSVAANVTDADTVICDRNGTVLFCSDAPLGCAHQGMTITGKENLSRILSEEYVVSQGEIAGLYPDARYVVFTPIPNFAGNAWGFVMVSVPMASTVAVLQRLSDIYLFVSVFVVLAAVVATALYTRKSSHPLQDMAKTATAFGHGNFKARAKVPEDASEEIQELALAFNNMAQSLEKSDLQHKEFVANVSHELKTPMTTIGGYVDGILDGTVPEHQQRRYLQIVSDETKRLSRLVRSMLDVSRLQDEGTIPEEKKLQFDLAECAGQVLIAFEQKINDKALEVQVDMPEHPVITFACQDYITQVLYNLLDNAIKFCPRGGCVGLQLRQGGNKLYFTVSNDSETIPAQELPLLFDRFHKLDKSRSEHREGWGLGLYIVKTLICSHGEDISVSSTAGKTEFTFTLPLAH